MLARAGGYYKEEFQGFLGVTWGDPLPPTIFSVVVDAVVHQWISLATGFAGGQDLWGGEVLHHSNFFYTDDGLVV